jgi:acetyl-CoA carboxylase biotin carboxylase subunit
MVKAVAGGGGKGMREVAAPGALLNAVRTARSEAGSAFGDTAVYFERRITNPRHIETQLLADAHGAVIPFVERECSIQRRHQKIVEEAPATAFVLPEPRPALLHKLLDAGLKAARAVGYANAGTCEFLLVGDDFYFIELNARLQVEHPITEATTGLDLVQLQLRIAAGEHLQIGQDDVRAQGHAIECRINAEDPVKFFPSPGPVKRFDTPVPADGAFHDGIRIDAGYRAGDTVTPFYDSLLAKIISHAPTREAATARMRAALQGFAIEGLKTNIPLHQKVLASEAFARGELDTRFLERIQRP